MKRAIAKEPRATSEAELMILPDGRVLVHNLTAMVAEALVELNPADESIQRRVLAKASGVQPPGPGRIQATDGAGC